MKDNVKPLIWNSDKLQLIDQRKLPRTEEFIVVTNISECHEAIRSMVVRGAPLIGFTAIFGMALWIRDNESKDIKELESAGEYLSTARPTAVNLKYEIDRVLGLGYNFYKENGTLQGLSEKVVAFGLNEMEKLEADNKRAAHDAYLDLMNRYGDKKFKVMTICNTGTLACGVLGTAFGVINYLNEIGSLSMAYALETRPYLQGLRLTSYEMVKNDVPHRIISDGAASYIIENEGIDAVFTGADRIAKNGDTANKIGTNNLAILCKHYNIPFYAVAPTSTFDLSLDSGDLIDIEMRDEEEVLSFNGERVAPTESRAQNPSFDVTKASLIAGLFCEKGKISPVNEDNVVSVVRKNHD